MRSILGPRPPGPPTSSTARAGSGRLLPGGGRLRILPLLAAALLAGCAYRPPPIPSYRQTDTTGAVWSDGLHLRPAGTRPLDFTTAYMSISPTGMAYGSNHVRPLTFRVVAANVSAETVTVDPARFRAYLPGPDSVRVEARTASRHARPYWDTYGAQQTQRTVPRKKDMTVLDPELVVGDARRRIDQEEKNRAALQATEGAFALVGALAATAAFFAGVKETEEERRRRERDEREAEEYREQRERDRKERLAQEAALIEEWSRRSLRKATLLPGARAEGFIALASTDFTRLPDTLVLQYQVPDGRLQDIGRYHLAYDSIPRL